MFKSLLVPLDGSEYSERALASALELARLTGAKVTVVTVILAYEDAHVPHVQSLDARAKDRAETYLQRFIAEGRTAGFEMLGVVRYGSPAKEIADVARENDADLVVMSTHGIGADGRHALGSVALRVLETVPCRVLLEHIAPRN